MKTLYVKYLLDASLVNHPYTTLGGVHHGDAGFDLIVQNDTICSPRQVTTIHHDIACEMKEVVQDSFTRVYHSNFNSYFLVPRSSMTKTPLLMANSPGIIDSMYRGEIMGKLFNNSDEEYFIKGGTRLLQIVAATLEPINVEIVTSLSETTRGADGFGSTGA